MYEIHRGHRYARVTDTVTGAPIAFIDFDPGIHRGAWQIATPTGRPGRDMNANERDAVIDLLTDAGVQLPDGAHGRSDRAA